MPSLIVSQKYPCRRMTLAKASDRICDLHFPLGTSGRIWAASPSRTNFCKGEYPRRSSLFPMSKNFTDCLQILAKKFLSTSKIPSARYFQHGSLYPVVIVRLRVCCIQGLVLSSSCCSAFDRESAFEFKDHGILSICSCSKLRTKSFAMSTYFLSVRSFTSYSRFICWTSRFE